MLLLVFRVKQVERTREIVRQVFDQANETRVRKTYIFQIYFCENSKKNLNFTETPKKFCKFSRDF